MCRNMYRTVTVHEMATIGSDMVSTARARGCPEFGARWSRGRTVDQDSLLRSARRITRTRRGTRPQHARLPAPRPDRRRATRGAGPGQAEREHGLRPQADGRGRHGRGDERPRQGDNSQRGLGVPQASDAVRAGGDRGVRGAGVPVHERGQHHHPPAGGQRGRSARRGARTAPGQFRGVLAEGPDRPWPARSFRVPAGRALPVRAAVQAPKPDAVRTGVNVPDADPAPFRLALPDQVEVARAFARALVKRSLRDRRPARDLPQGLTPAPQDRSRPPGRPRPDWGGPAHSARPEGEIP